MRFGNWRSQEENSCCEESEPQAFYNLRRASVSVEMSRPPQCRPNRPCVLRTPANFHRRSVRVACGGSLLREFVLGDDCFEPRDIFQQPLAGQDQEVIAELRVLEVDLQ